MRSRASKISNLCKSLIAAVALMSAADSARANPNYWPTGAIMGPDVVGFETSAGLANNVAYYTPITVPAGSYILTVNLPMSTVSVPGYVSFAIYSSNSSSTAPYNLQSISTPVPVSNGQVASYTFASPGFQNLTTTTLWVAFSFSPGTSGYFDTVYPNGANASNTLATFITPGSGTIASPTTQQSLTYIVSQTYNSWPSIVPSGGSFGGGNLGTMVPLVYFTH